jgi:hypothetical protein
MARNILVFLVVGTVACLLCSASSAEVPHMINYQGKLTSASGGCLNDTVQMTFTIYADSFGTTSEWTETQTEVMVKEGVFSVLLGSVNHIPGGDTVFDGSIQYLGVQVESDPEMRPLKPMVSVAYAYRAGTTDGGGVNCEDCDDRFVNVLGPDSVVADSGPAFFGGVAGGSSSDLVGIEGHAENTSSGFAYGGLFSTSSSGTGAHIGVSGIGRVSSGTYSAIGCDGYAENQSSGWAVGGNFVTATTGTGEHCGVSGYALGSSSADTYGSNGEARNTSDGRVYGGYFKSYNDGTGPHYGVAGNAWGNSPASAYGSYAYVRNDATGNAYAGYFYAAPVGTGTKYGVWASAPADQGWAGYFEGDVRIIDSLVVLGGKSAAVKVDGGEYRLLYSQESPEVWFEDFGEGQLENGRAHIDLDPLFLETVTLNSQHPMKVFIQLTSGEPMNVVVHKGITGFDIVAEDINSDATFDYRVVAKRKGYENIRLAKMRGPTPEEVAAEQEKHQAELEQERAEMEQERMERLTELR